MSSRILIGDPSLIVRMELSEILVEAGHLPLACATLGEVRAALAARPADALLIEPQLPDGDGLALVAELRASPATAHMPVAMLVSEPHAHRPSAIADRLVKPCRRADVLALVTKLLDQAHPSPAPSASEASARRLRVLIVDADAGYRARLAAALSAEQVEVVTAGTAEEGLQSATATPPDALVLDADLPGAGAAAVLKRLGEDPLLRRVEVLALATARVDPAMELQCLENGADDVLARPEDPGAVVARVRARLARKVREDEHRRREDEQRRRHAARAAAEADERLADTRTTLLADIETTNRMLAWSNAELARLRDQALEASRLKSEFLATMSHEIRTPMNAVLGMTSLLLGTKLDAEQKDFALTVRSGAEYLLTLINDILDLSKIEAGKLTLEPAPFDFRHTLSSLADLMAPEAAEKRLQLSVDYPAVLPSWIHADERRIRQVLMNLVSNAIKFTHTGRVLVRVSAIPQARDAEPGTLGTPQTPGTLVDLQVAVEDTGIGIAADLLPQLFSKFSQVDASNTRRFGGTGLGLAISKQLLELMGGRISVTSTPGRGSRFTIAVAMPLAVPARTEAAAARAPQLAVEIFDARVLVVDDNAMNQRLACKLLEKLGCRVDVAVDGSEAVRLAALIAYDAVFMDCQMPVMDGYEATRQLRAPRETSASPRDVPIIGLTASAMPGDRERCLNAGMNDYLTKPVTREDFERTLDPLLKRRAGSSADVAAPPPSPPRVTAPAATSTVLDLDRAKHLLESFGLDVVGPFADLLEKSADTNMEAMRTALTQRDGKSLARAAHALRGTCLNLGARSMAELCLEIEDRGNAGALDDVDGVLDRLAHAWALTGPEINALWRPAA